MPFSSSRNLGYNSRLQLQTLEYSKNAADLLNLTYGYNQTVNGQSVNNGQIQTITDTRGAAFSEGFAYDALGRLSQGQTNDLTAANTWKLGWTYDRYGNRTAQSLLGGTLSVTAPQLTVNPATNRITTAGYAYDAAGNMTSDSIHAYAFDAENRVKTVDTTAATYSYDGKGLRVKKVVGATTTIYVFSGSKVIAEYVNGALNQQYVYAGSQLLATLAPGGAATYRHMDLLSARVETNSSGVTTRTFGHLPFGDAWYETGTVSKWKFTSYERDAESQLDYATFRYDSSRLGGFMTGDPIGGWAGDPQSLNRYAYVGNDPVSYTDDLGLCGDERLPCMKTGPSVPRPQSPNGGGGGGGGGVTCIWDGVETDCGMVQGALDSGAAALCPSGSIICVYNDNGVFVYSPTADDGWTWNRVDPNSSATTDANNGSWFQNALNYLKKVPVNLTVIVPVLGIAGPAVTVTYLPQTNNLCVAPGLGASVGRNVSAGPLVLGNLANAQSITQGASISVGAQALPIAGAQATGNQSGILGGPTVGIPGGSVTATYGVCF